MAAIRERSGNPRRSGGAAHPRHRRWIKKAWLPIVKAAKLQHFRFHDLRHTFASKLVMADAASRL
jgi:integrase